MMKYLVKTVYVCTIYSVCNCNVIRDEFHNLFHCTDIIFIKIREFNAYRYISTHNKMFTNCNNYLMLVIQQY